MNEPAAHSNHTFQLIYTYNALSHYYTYIVTNERFTFQQRQLVIAPIYMQTE